MEGIILTKETLGDTQAPRENPKIYFERKLLTKTYEKKSYPTLRSPFILLPYILIIFL